MDSQQLVSQQQDPVQQVEVLDADEVPPEYRKDEVASGRGRRGNRRGHNDKSRRNIPRDQPTLPSHGTTRRVSGHGARHPAPANDSPSIIKRFTRMVWSSSPNRSSVKGDFEQHEQERHKRQNNTENPPEEFHGGDGTCGLMPRPRNDITESEQAFQDMIEGKEREWEARERELQHQINQISHHFEESTRILQAKLHESESAKLFMQEQHQSFIRKQQEASFRQMESARWLPMDEGKVMDDLDRLKRDMRSWAKAMSIKDNSLLQSFKEVESAALMRDLANVALIENGQLLNGLSTAARAPMLLLNALLAHSVYTSFFRSPFFFVGNNDANAPSNVRPEGILQDVYERAQEANQQDAHVWRSQTLRLLMPPLRTDASDAEKQLRRTTEDSIAQAADRHASDFLASAASHLIENKAQTDFTNKLKKIYSDAARLSYMLWTRRTEMRCFTLHEIENLAFDAESPYFDPDSLLRFDDYEDHLKGKRVTVMVHPLLKVYGTDEAKAYDQERVWAKGVVWLNSKNA
ncbi:uncharacterized protein PAC_17307 [Phialocephala subalpina]|uniref:Uncharacterized protein n=1 Tax=Phialocephala subalpina TaxID=576137 RepID=A0A1L7XR26_9HELO|nr:uncharacterized protein PAC_17307 [Phialocephala subalpina]